MHTWVGAIAACSHYREYRCTCRDNKEEQQMYLSRRIGGPDVTEGIMASPLSTRSMDHKFRTRSLISAAGLLLMHPWWPRRFFPSLTIHTPKGPTFFPYFDYLLEKRLVLAWTIPWTMDTTILLDFWPMSAHSAKIVYPHFSFQAAVHYWVELKACR
jgi:hypothetical protein